MRHDKITIRVPATTANMGPGFDCLGMALDLWNSVTIEQRSTTKIKIQGEGATSLASNRRNKVFQAIELLCSEIQAPIPSIHLTCVNDIPLARGLGSSAAAIVGGLLAANVFHGEPVSKTRILKLATQMEGHPDNVTPALLGGCQIAVPDGESIITASIPLEKTINVILYIPDSQQATAEARAILPKTVKIEDAVFNVAHAALLIHALHTGELNVLRAATLDRLHQPARQQIFPAMPHIFRAALSAGALGVFLSGGGPTIVALAQGKEVTIGYEMADAAEKAGLAGQVRIVQPTSRGAHILEEA